MSALDDVLGFFDKKKEKCANEAMRYAAQQKRDLASKINKGWFDKAKEDIWGEVKNGPLAQLGKDFIAEQVASNGQQLIRNVGNQIEKSIGPYAQMVEEAKDLAFNAVALAMTAQNQMGLYFMRTVAEQAIKAIDQKNDCLVTLKEKIRLLYNALVVLTAGQPFFNKYLARLRQALIKIYEADQGIRYVNDNLTIFNRWYPKRFEDARLKIEEALELLEPATNRTKAEFTSSLNLAMPIDLSVKKWLKIGVDGMVREINVAGAKPVATTKDEIVAKINRAFGKTVAYATSTIKIVSNKTGNFSKITIEKPVSGEDATAVVFGLNQSKLPYTYQGVETTDGRVNITDSGLLQNVGIPKEPQQLTVLLMIPKLCKDAALAANGYLIANIKLNALLIAFCNGYDELIKVSSNAISKFSSQQFNLIDIQLQKLYKDMAKFINGAEDAIYSTVPGYEPDSVRVSAYTLEWTIRLRIVHQHLRVIPGKSLDILQADQNATNIYRSAVAKIKAMGNITRGGATLVAIEGREEIAQMERQLVFFLLQAMASTVSGSASKTVLTAGRSLMNRIDLSIERDQEIKRILQTFTTANLGFSAQLESMGKNIDSLLGKLGMDKARDDLNQGKFQQFFSNNAKTVTYGGAALAGISMLKKCVSTDEQRQKCDAAEDEAKNENLYRQQQVARLVNNSQGALVADLQKNCLKNDELQDGVKQLTKTLAGPCGVAFPFSGSSFLDTVGPALGISLFGAASTGSLSKTLGVADQKLGKFGRGIL